MSLKTIAVIILIGLVVSGLLFYYVNPLSVLVLEVSYTYLPQTVNDQFHDVLFTFNVSCHNASIPTYQLANLYRVVPITNHLTILNLRLNFSLVIGVYNDIENGTLWRRITLVFSSLLERKIQIYMQKPSNVTLSGKVVVVVDAHLVAWYEGEGPFLDKSLHQAFTVNLTTTNST